MAKVREYLNLIADLRDLDLENDTFSVSLFSADVGYSQPVKVPYHFADLENQLDKLERKRLVEENLIALGQQLADRLLPPGEIRALFLDAYKKAGRAGGIRLRLLIREPQLAQLPWEYTYFKIHHGEDDIRHFLALNPQISIVRFDPLTEPEPSLGHLEAGPLRMVAVMANVTGYGKLKLKYERDVIEQAVVTSPTTDIQITWDAFVEDATVEDLKLALQAKPHLFHFAGHGIFETAAKAPPVEVAAETRFGRVKQGPEEKTWLAGQGAIVLAADKITRAPAHFPAGQLAAELQSAGVRLALLGACDSGRQDGLNVWTGIAPALIERGIPAVVAMQYEVIDDYAVAFNKMFYQALTNGLSVDEAVSAGRSAMWASARRGEAEWGVPVLYLRATNGTLFPERHDDPARDSVRNESQVRANQQIADLYGQANAVEVDKMLEGLIEAQQKINTVHADGSAIAVEIGTLGGGGITSNQDIGTVEKGGSVTGVTIGSLGGGRFTKIENPDTQGQPFDQVDIDLSPDAQRINIQKLLTAHNQRLQILKEQEALAGPLQVDPAIPIQIEKLEAKIQELQVELETLEDDG
jgi:hypothetical protein